MLQAFIVVLREGFESFLIVAIILSYLARSGQRKLIPGVYWGILGAVAISAAGGYALMRGVNESLWEGVIGMGATVLVVSLVIHMWRIGPRLKQVMEQRLEQVSMESGRSAVLGVFLLTILMISREGMETALMLFQIHDPQIVTGILLGIAAAIGLSAGWMRYGRLINIRRFFQVTGIYLILFSVQIAIYSMHEFAESGVLPGLRGFHDATEPLSPDGIYGKWFSIVMLAICAVWLVRCWLVDRSRQPQTSVSNPLIKVV